MFIIKTFNHTESIERAINKIMSYPFVERPIIGVKYRRIWGGNLAKGMLYDVSRGGFYIRVMTITIRDSFDYDTKIDMESVYELNIYDTEE